jgi:hypothetical protein
MKTFHRRVEHALNALLFLLGAWSLYALICIFGKANFSTIRTFSFLPLVAALGLWIVHRRETSLDLPLTDEGSRQRDAASIHAIRLWPPFALAALYVVGRIIQGPIPNPSLAPRAAVWSLSDWLFWFGAIAYLWIDFPRTALFREASETSDAGESRVAKIAIATLCILAAGLTAGTNRPADDDAYFVNVAVAAKEFPAASPQSFDAMHRSGLPPVEQTLHLPQTYEVLVGMISSISGMSVLTLYYVLLPPLWAVLGTLATWVVLRAVLRSRDALIGLCFFVFLQVFWGEYRSFGTFGYVHLSFGKAAYVTVILPLVVLAAWRWRQRPNAAAWLLLAFSQFAAVCVTTNGVVVAPLATLLVILVRPGRDVPFLRVLVLGAAASLPMLLGTAAMLPRLLPYRAALSVDETWIGPWVTLSLNRAPLVVLSLTLLPALTVRAKLRHAHWIVGYVRIVVLVMFLPAVSAIAAFAIGHVYGWRLLWSVPMPLLVSFAGGLAAGRLSMQGRIVKVLVALWVILFAFAGKAAILTSTWSFSNITRPKVYTGNFNVAETVLRVARTDAPVLAPEPIAIYLTNFAGTPPLIGVRELYLIKLRNFVPIDDLAMRMALFKYVRRADPSPTLNWPDITVLGADDALRLINNLGIATVVFPARHRDASALKAGLAGRGFDVQNVNGYVIAARPR